MSAIENMTYSGLLGLTGNNPMFLGLTLLAGFVGIVFLLPVRGDVKIMVIVPAVMLAAGNIDFLRPLLFIGILGILAFAMLKFMNR